MIRYKVMFKKILFLFLIPSIIFSGFSFAKADSAPNLILNPNATQMDSNGKPLYWQTGTWGANSPGFQYQNDSVNGGVLKVSISSYSSGDAKWYFNPVTIQPNTQYLYTDYYLSNVPTDIVAQVSDANGNLSYPYLGTVPASSTFQKASFALTTSASASKITIFHLLNRVGNLQTKTFSLMRYQTPTTPDAIPNGSLEQISPTNSSMPDFWQKGNWGSNKATFSYLNTGHTGSRSVKVALSNRTSGAAEWYYTPQPVTPGQNYKFSDYYISNVTTEVDLMLNKIDGTTQYITLASVGAASVWTKFSTTFVMPDGVMTASIMHILYNNGSLTTDDYTLSSYVPQKFSRPIVSLTFDDGYDSYSTNALPSMAGYGYKSTAYIITSEVGDLEGGYMTLNQIKSAYAAGNEIGSHTVNHPDLTTLSSTKLTRELVNSKNYLQTNLGTTVTDFAIPYGTYNANVTSAIKKYYRSSRTVDMGYNTPDNFDPYRIVVQNIDINTTTAQFQSWIDYTSQNNCWLVLVYHGVDNSGEQYSISPQNFQTQLQYIYQKNLTVETMSQALSEASSQIK